MSKESEKSPAQQPHSPLDDASTRRIEPLAPFGDQLPLSIQERGIPKMHKQQRREPPQEEDTPTTPPAYDLGEVVQPSAIEDPIPVSIQKRPVVVAKPEYRGWGVRLEQLFKTILRKK